MKGFIFSVLLGLFYFSWSIPVSRKNHSNSRDICNLPPEEGPCRAYFQMWFYNVTSHQCEMFVYGGCEGNNNRFQKQKDCEKLCKENQDNQNNLVSGIQESLEMNNNKKKGNAEEDRSQISMSKDRNFRIDDILKDYQTITRKRRSSGNDEEEDEEVDPDDLNLNDLMRLKQRKEDIGEQSPEVQLPSDKTGDQSNPGKAGDQSKSGGRSNPGKAGDQSNPGKAGDQSNHGKADAEANHDQDGDYNMKWRNQDIIQPNQNETSHFAAFFLTSIVAVFAFYLIYHNRQKIIAS